MQSKNSCRLQQWLSYRLRVVLLVNLSDGAAFPSPRPLRFVLGVLLAAAGVSGHKWCRRRWAFAFRSPDSRIGRHFSRLRPTATRTSCSWKVRMRRQDSAKGAVTEEEQTKQRDGLLPLRDPTLAGFSRAASPSASSVRVGPWGCLRT